MQDGRIDYNEFVIMMHMETAPMTRNPTKNSFVIGFKEPLPALCFNRGGYYHVQGDGRYRDTIFLSQDLNLHG